MKNILQVGIRSKKYTYEGTKTGNQIYFLILIKFYPGPDPEQSNQWGSMRIRIWIHSTRTLKKLLEINELF
jgi:hypothetical protein